MDVEFDGEAAARARRGQADDTKFWSRSETMARDMAKDCLVALVGGLGTEDELSGYRDFLGKKGSLR